jgi:hypothetical protein
MTYPSVLKRDVDKKVEEKKLKIHSEMSNMINDMFNVNLKSLLTLKIVEGWLSKDAGKNLLEVRYMLIITFKLINEKRSLDLSNREKPVPEREIDPRLLCIMVQF